MLFELSSKKILFIDAVGLVYTKCITSYRLYDLEKERSPFLAI